MQSNTGAAPAASDTSATAGRAPLLTAAQGTQGRFTHSSAGGFCSVCGTVWPCARANDDRAGQSTGVPKMRPSHRD